MLLALESANLFIVPLDDRREWYRYHHLFADVLRGRLLSEQPEQIPLLHQRASGWYERHEMAGDAVRHALAALDFDGAVRLMELALPAIRRNRQDAMLFAWLKALPDDAVRRSPALSVFHGFMHMASGDLDAVEPRLRDAERALAEVPDGSAPPWADTEELRTLPATIAVYRASLAQARGDVAGTVEHAQHALDIAGPNDHLSRGSAAGFLGLAAWSKGDVSTAPQTFTQAVASLHASGNLIDELSSTVVLADMWVVAGQPGKARTLYRNALERAEAEGESVARATAELHVGISEIDREAWDLVSARRHLETAAQFIERGLMTESRYRWFLATGLLALAEGDPVAAINFLEQAEPLYRRGFFPDVRPIAAVKARVWIAQGKLEPAAEWALERGLSIEDDVTYLSEFDHLTLVRLFIAQHRALPETGAVEQATRLLDRLLDAAQASGRAGSVLEIRMLQALAHGARGLNSPAEGQAAGVRRGAPSSSPEPLSERELQVLRHLDSEMSGPQIAKALFISYNTLRTHTKHIFTKLDVADRRAAVRRARERGLM
ncbi:LuxR C-terminal-related transcriptional regulator [Arthrobacter sp. MMS18-M83]|uniref:LuxR C-terminal-related transcriptional regulator n=1 Tax=Arthrobacter sp. MMS18-M83 TaxID=2996261 RepID=UPI002DD44D6F|nr:LuxR C-terminal-related transcriptional regulator [Arthrobacter sp. MMS18-M83]